MVHRCIVLPLIFLATSANVVNGFRVGSEGNLGKAVEDLLNTVKTPPSPTEKDDAPPLRNEILKTEVPCMYEYWRRPDIHTLGNIGIGGALHAAMAPFATKVSSIQVMKRRHRYYSFVAILASDASCTPTFFSLQRR